ncbi:MAG: 2-C-methyl-D-erythritol 4-phosphate cytidylyltransferase [Actinomycetota bacterium]
MTVAVIVTAAGSGTRLGHALPKAFVPLAGEPLLAHALRGASSVADHLIVTAPPGHLAAAHALAEPFGAVVVAGGATRQASVAAGLTAVPAGAEVVLVHDAARALTPPESFGAVVEAVRKGFGAVVPALAVVDTVKEVEPAAAGAPERVLGTPDRARLRAVQTPQGFDRALLERAHAAAPEGCASDDAGLVEELGEDVWVVPGSEFALKITTARDLEVAQRWVTAVREERE